jgi:flagellar biogenesis protein FliO
MDKAPLISIIHAIVLLPLAFLFIYSFVAGKKKWKFHAQTAALAIVIDLIISVAYMLNRLLGDKFSDSQANFTGGVLVYIIVHGIIATILIIMEIAVLVERIINHRKKPKTKFHTIMSKVLFYTWCFIFITGELFFAYVYLL